MAKRAKGSKRTMGQEGETKGARGIDGDGRARVCRHASIVRREAQSKSQDTGTQGHRRRRSSRVAGSNDQATGRREARMVDTIKGKETK